MPIDPVTGAETPEIGGWQPWLPGQPPPWAVPAAPPAPVAPDPMAAAVAPPTPPVLPGDVAASQAAAAAAAPPVEPIPAPASPDGLPPSAVPPTAQGLDPGAAVAAGGPPALSQGLPQGQPPVASGEQPPVPDAITGAPPATVADFVNVRPERPEDTPLEVRARADNPDAADRDLAIQQLSERDPEGFVRARRQQEGDRDAWLAQRKQDLIDQDLEQQRRNVAARERAAAESAAKAAQIAADADKLAKTRIDPHGNLTGFQRVAGVVAAIIGGLVQHRTGRNFGLDALNDAIARSITAQKEELAGQREALGVRRNLLGEEMAQHGDEYVAAEKLRLASYKAAEDRLVQQQQLYDPRGSQAFQIGQDIAQLRGARAQAQRDLAQKDFDNRLKVLDAADKAATVELAKQSKALEGARFGLEERKFGYQQQKDAADRQLEREKLDVKKKDDRREDVRKYAIGGIPQIEAGPDGKPVIGADGQPVVTTSDLKNKDGSTWLAASPEEAKALREKKTAATQLVKIYDRIDDLRERVGGESRVWNSDEFQELKSLQSDALLLVKSGTQGMSSDHDSEVLENSAGISDLTSWRDQTAGIRAARARTIDKLNQTFRDARYDGPAFRFDRARPSTNTPAEDKTQRLLEKPKETLDQAVRREIDKRIGDRGYDIDITDPRDRAIYDEARTAATDRYHAGASIPQQDSIAALGKLASQGDATARETLQKIAATANTTKLRELAQVELNWTTPKPTPRGPASQAEPVPAALQYPGPGGP